MLKLPQNPKHILDQFGPNLGYVGTILGDLRAFWNNFDRFGAILGHFGPILTNKRDQWHKSEQQAFWRGGASQKAEAEPEHVSAGVLGVVGDVLVAQRRLVRRKWQKMGQNGYLHGKKWLKWATSARQKCLKMGKNGHLQRKCLIWATMATVLRRKWSIMVQNCQPQLTRGLSMLVFLVVRTILPPVC